MNDNKSSKFNKEYIEELNTDDAGFDMSRNLNQRCINTLKSANTECDVSGKLNEECGVFAIYDRSGEIDVAQLTYYALYALQHRGQEACGIAVNDNGKISVHKDVGLVKEVFDNDILDSLKGQSALGHVLYTIEDEDGKENSEPMVIRYKKGKLAISYNGRLVNCDEIRRNMAEEGVLFQSTSDAELILNLISRNAVGTSAFEETLIKTQDAIKGAYAFAIMTPNEIYGLRDPLGIKPLCIGRIDDSYLLASESCALDAVGATFVRDVEPGEIVSIDADGFKTLYKVDNDKTSFCVFEHVYFARPDSVIDGASVYNARINMGIQLAKESPVDADIVVGVPDSGISAAIGYSRESGIKYETAIVKNRYIGRTFIKPKQMDRDEGVKIKLNVLKSAVEGKRVVLIDDSIVRGTTIKNLINLLRDGGAKEVHIRISSPPFVYPCKYGIDTPSQSSLVAYNYTIDEIKENIGADSLAFISVDGILKTPVGSKCGFCTACFTGEYPVL